MCGVGFMSDQRKYVYKSVNIPGENLGFEEAPLLTRFSHLSPLIILHHGTQTCKIAQAVLASVFHSKKACNPEKGYRKSLGLNSRGSWSVEPASIIWTMKGAITKEPDPVKSQALLKRLWVFLGRSLFRRLTWIYYVTGAEDSFRN